MSTFKTQARAVDMLGRQQIAGIPTAISELFKNAHDAYASRVQVDLYRKDALLILRDNGLGMTRDDLESRWLTLGTDSKVGSSSGMRPPFEVPVQQARPILGEKGIGRLAVAVLGPQMLLLSHAKRDDGLHDLVAAFIHWGFFALPGVYLEEIDIPIRVFKSGRLPSGDDVRAMVESLADLAGKLRSDESRLSDIAADLARFKADPSVYDSFIPELKLGTGPGTHFYISPTNPNIFDDIDGSDRVGRGIREREQPLIRLLIGFSDTMTPSHEEPRIETAFNDHTSYGKASNLIAENEFFVPSDFQKADHSIQGEFDEFGQFSGTVSIYQGTPIRHAVAWSHRGGEKTACGSFKIALGYVQGTLRESKVPAEEYPSFVEKLERVGGLYVYRNGIRVLPYGDNDYDWLDIERNRTKSASYYFFSYRRMFGAVLISNQANQALLEKAGREGFQENTAYREFQRILKNFFVQIAADFFRSGGAYSEEFERERSLLDRTEAARRTRDSQALTKRRKLQADLNQWFARVSERDPQAEVANLIDNASERLQRSLSQADKRQAALDALDVESSLRKELALIQDSYTVARPRGFGMTKSLTREYAQYGVKLQQLRREVFLPALKTVEALVDTSASAARVQIDNEQRVARSFDDLVERSRKQLEREASALTTDATQALGQLRILSRNIRYGLEEVVSEARAELARTSINLGTLAENLPPLDRVATALESYLEEIREAAAQVTLLRQAIDSQEGISTTLTTEAMEEELLALRQRLDEMLELAQAGFVIEVISHEFGRWADTMGDSISELAVWSRRVPALVPLQESLQNSFDNVTGYLSMLRPILRRRNIEPVPVSGREVAGFLGRLFSTDFIKHGISFEATKGFDGLTFVVVPATIYSAFVNLVDNAVFWLKDESGDRRVILDEDAGDALISDTGPGIGAQDSLAIFDYGFTRKPGGRGIGLNVAQESLDKAGYRLSFDDEGAAKGATFRISQKGEAEL